MEAIKNNESIFGLVFRALNFAAEKHKHQRRKDAEQTPYINHPIAVADILCKCCHLIGPEVLAAALLHDTLEDTATSESELAGQFGPVITALVKEVTDDKSLPKAERKELQIVHARTSSHSAKLIKLADKIANINDILAFPPADWTHARRVEYLDWAAKVVSGLTGTDRCLEDLFACRLNEARAKLGKL